MTSLGSLCASDGDLGGDECIVCTGDGGGDACIICIGDGVLGGGVAM